MSLENETKLIFEGNKEFSDPSKLKPQYL